ncbi:hypothetical protein [Clostridium sp. BJN0001]|uniref:hypothetical protein n=1 Tax=Clostridium sp. BJN0001 TaxID=2930219 RepID=UPI001FD29C3E|nr:hypothetical protein [Clostridium sp. BJN0001]
MEKIILFGASKKGKIAYNVLKEKYDICYFCDNDKNKWNTYFCNKKIISTDELLKYKEDKIIITSEYYGEISFQLKSYGLKNIYVFWYADINDITYKKKYFINKAVDLGIINNIKLETDTINKHKITLKENNNKIGRNVLMIAYDFPPTAGSSVQRVLKFAKYLKYYKWNPIIVTTDKYYGTQSNDESLLQELDEGIKIVRIKCDIVYSEQLDNGKITNYLNIINKMIANKEKLINFINLLNNDFNGNRKNVLIPDPFVFWAYEVIQNIENYVNMNDIDIIYSTSAPYSDHIAAYFIKDKYSIPWVADYRDSWIGDPYKSKMPKERQELEEEIEKAIVNYADRIIEVTPLITEEYINVFSLDRKKVLTITNGYDEEDFNNYIGKTKNNKFKITYTGTLFQNRLCANLFNAVNNLISENKISADNICIEFYGKLLGDTSIRIKEYDKNNICQIGGYLAHKDAIYLNSKSNLLLLPIGKEDKFKSIYTGKVFEYLRLYKPILALSPKGSLVEKLLLETKSGKNFKYEDLEGIKEYIYNQYMLWKENKEYIGYDKDKILNYDRRTLTRKLADIFNEIIC